MEHTIRPRQLPAAFVVCSAAFRIAGATALFRYFRGNVRIGRNAAADGKENERGQSINFVQQLSSF